MTRLDVEEAFAGAGPLVPIGRKRHVPRSYLVALHDAEVVRVEERLDARRRRRSSLTQGVRDRLRDHAAHVTVGNRVVRRRLLRRQPAVPAMVRGVQAEDVQEALERPVAALLDFLEVLPHRRRAPRRVARQVGEVVPVRRARRHEDHGVVRRAAAQRAGARIPDALLRLDELAIAALLREIGVVPDVVVPAHRGIFGREGMERRNLVVVARLCLRIAAGLEHEHRVAVLGEPRRDGPSARAGADDDVVGIAGGRGLRPPDDSGDEGGLEQVAATEPAHQNVLRKAISARLSSADRPGSSWKRSVPK
jgi:hypothetical protein